MLFVYVSSNHHRSKQLSVYRVKINVGSSHARCKLHGREAARIPYHLLRLRPDELTRNAAKARLKDTTRRTQKGFFGRQRLDILAKGVSAYSTWGKQTPDCSRKPVSLISEIGLAHAFNDAHRTPEVNSFTRYSFIPSPIHVSPCTPHLKKTMPHDEPSSGSRSHSSEVLDALDTYEREQCLSTLI